MKKIFEQPCITLLNILTDTNNPTNIMRKIVFIFSLFAFLLFQSGCVRHSKCDCIDESTTLSGVLIIYEDPLIFGVKGQYKVPALLLPGNPSQEEIEKALNRDINPFTGNFYLIRGNRTINKKYHLQNVNLAVIANYHNCFDEPATYRILCIEKK